MGSAGDRYGLEYLPADCIPEGAEFLSCNVIPTCHNDSGNVNLGGEGNAQQQQLLRSSGMVCLAMLTPPVPRGGAADRGTSVERVESESQQGDAAGGPTVRWCTTGSNPSGTTAATALAGEHPGSANNAGGSGGGLLNVYPMGNEERFKVERALQRQPQQIGLSYIPVGVANTTVWRSTPTPDFVGDASCNSMERGDAVLVWDQDGLVHLYTRWEQSLDDNGRGGGGSGAQVILAEESPESLAVLLPELKCINGSVRSLAVDVVDDDGTGVPRRKMVVGCADGVHVVSLEVLGGKKETSFCYVNGPVPSVALNKASNTFFTSQGGGDDDVDGEGGMGAENEVLGVACGRLGMVSWFVQGGSGKSAGEGQGLARWLSETTPLAHGDTLVCMGCADFCRDGSTSVAVGTHLGKVTVYGVALYEDTEEAPPGGHEGLEATPGGEDIEVADEAFGIPWLDSDEDGSFFSETSPRRSESISPRPSIGDGGFADRQTHSRLSDRLSSSVRNRSMHKLRPDSMLTTKWQREVPHPVFGVVCGDFNHDGVSEVVVATQHGVHVFAPDYRHERGRLGKVLSAIKTLLPEEAASVASSSDNDGHDSGVNMIGVQIHTVGATPSAVVVVAGGGEQ